jgi:hypothetical protein
VSRAREDSAKDLFWAGRKGQEMVGTVEERVIAQSPAHSDLGRLFVEGECGAAVTKNLKCPQEEVLGLRPHKQHA